jgi:hypothetical protein
MKAKAKELDRRFDAGEDITMYLDLSRARRPGHEQRRVNVDFPVGCQRSFRRRSKRFAEPCEGLKTVQQRVPTRAHWGRHRRKVISD